MKRKDLLALSLFALLTVVFFWKLALTNRVLAGVDLFTFFYPYRDYASRTLLAGRLPLWNPHIFLGVPFLADSQTALFYPLHWPLLGLSAPQAIAWSIVAHVLLAGAGTYLFARRVGGIGVAGSLVAAMVFALGGFLGAQAEHVNQLNTAAWLPWLLLALDRALAGRRWATPAGGVLIAVMVLAGHAQAAYINLAGMAIFALVRPHDSQPSGWRSPARWRRALGPLAAMSLLGAGLAAVQLLPTAELSRLSIRAGGLSYRQAVSFSFDPRLVLRGLLPTFGYDAPLFSEYVAYAGVLALLLAWLGWRSPTDRRSSPTDRRSSPTDRRSSSGRWLPRFAAVMTATGLFLALGVFNPAYYLLYRLVPGFAWFRAPARWMLLSVWGLALLAGLGIDRVSGNIAGRVRAHAVQFAFLTAGIVAALSPFVPRPPWIVYAIWLLFLGLGLILCTLRDRLGRPLPYAALWVFAIAVELFWARRALAHTHPTAPQAYSDLRASIAHLRTDPGLFRVLSLSALTWDPGDLADMQTIWHDSLSDREMYDLVVATKEKEILAPNLPMHYGLQSVDGYGGGILPLARYSAVQRALLATATGRPASEIVINPDGRLRERLPDVPPTSMLSLLNVKYVIRDKLDDRWVDGVYYDLGLKISLLKPQRPVLTLSDLPDFWAGGLGLVSSVTRSTPLAAGEPVAEVVVTGQQGQQHRWVVRAGQETGQAQAIADGQARPIRQGPDGTEYLALWDWGELLHPQQIEVRALRQDTEVIVRGITLREQRTGTFDSVTVDPAFALTHSGDVKIYQNRLVLPRALLAFRAEAASDDAVLAALQDTRYRPQDLVYLAVDQATAAIPPSGGDRGGESAKEGHVDIRRYDPEHVEIDVATPAPAYLVLTDSYYPGWRAWIDDVPATILRADLLFRAVRVPAGDHRIRFAFQPRSLRWGAAISLLTALGIAGWHLVRKG